ncbi:MAG: carboxypeptidase-like regulatory domain-containing protein, partial [Bacteroidia bacterium]
MNKLFVLFCLLPFALFSQQKMTLSGYVTDQKSGERLPFVSVFDTVSKKGIYTNNFGFFSLTLPAGKAVLKVSCIGFKSEIRSFTAGKTEVWNVELGVGETLSGVDITADAAIEQRTQMSTIDIPVAQIKKIPAFMGEVDVIKVLQLTPGVHSGGEG